VHTLDNRVDGEDLDPVALRLHDRRIVADADQDPGRCRRQLLLNAGDELAFAHVRDGGRPEQPRSYFA
jgi:hypothetical protein